MFLTYGLGLDKMGRMTDSKTKFIEACRLEGYSSPISRSQIKAVVYKHHVPMPTWLLNVPTRKLPCGKFDISELTNAAPSVTITPVAVSTPTIPTQEEPVMSVLNYQPSVSTSATDNLIPAKLSHYVPYGHFSDISKIIESKRFYPVYITGLSGNGKTTMVEQVCSKLNREYVRVNITAQTDEDDLLGGFRLVDGNTVWQDGAVITAMKRGAILLLDEVDLGSHKIMCLQPVLEGKGIFLKKINKYVTPAPGFNVFATANTKGQAGEGSERFAGTNILNEAFLERFYVMYEQDYPSKAVEKRIVLNIMRDNGCKDEEFADNLVKWADIIRKTFKEGGVDDIITTRRLEHIVLNFSIFRDRMKAVTDCVGRFSADSRESFINLYTKIDANANVLKEAKVDWAGTPIPDTDAGGNTQAALNA